MWKSFKLYVNGNPIDISAMTGGRVFSVDISPVARNGENTLQVSNIVPAGLAEAVEVFIPYPEILEGDPAQEGVSTHTLSLISDLIETDIEYGFTSAQLAVIRNGRLIYNNAWGKTNSYLPDGSPCVDSSDVTTDTLYDLASVTKMFSVNYAFQKLLTDGQVDLDAKITDFLGDEFASEAVFMSESTPEAESNPEDDSRPDIETVRAWKAGLTIRDLLRHQGGFPASPRYCAPYVFVDNLPEGESYPENPIFAGNGADEETRQATVEMIFRTPLEYEPGTKTLYSDVDYIILGLVVEKITGKLLLINRNNCGFYYKRSLKILR